MGFLLYLGACCLLVAVVCPFVPMVEMFDYTDKGLVDIVAVPMCWGVAMGALIGICPFAGFHAFLVATNQTTIEFEANAADRCGAWLHWEPWRSPYDLGLTRNLLEVFGPSR